MTGVIVLALRLIAAAALYGFLGFALWTMWRQLKQSADRASGHRGPPIRLEATLGKQRSVVRLFKQAEVILGRDPLTDLVLNDTSVSARHARISFHHGQWWAEDLQSTNGTRLNRQALEGPTVLTNGDELRCGVARVLVSIPARRDQLAPTIMGGLDD